jgi:hypothetical protein
MSFYYNIQKSCNFAKFLIKIPVKYFNSFSTILQHTPNFSIVIMISAKSSTNPQNLAEVEDTFVNRGRIPTESPFKYSPPFSIPFSPTFSLAK